MTWGWTLKASTVRSPTGWPSLFPSFSLKEGIFLSNFFPRHPILAFSKLQL